MQTFQISYEKKKRKKGKKKIQKQVAQKSTIKRILPRISGKLKEKSAVPPSFFHPRTVQEAHSTLSSNRNYY